MRYRGYTKREEKTTHELWCDKMVEKAKQPQRILTVPTPKKSSGVRRNNYSTSEIISLLRG